MVLCGFQELPGAKEWPIWPLVNNPGNLAYFGLICSLLKQKRALNGLEWLLSNSLSWQLSFQIASAASIWIHGENYAKTLNFLSRTGHFLAYQNRPNSGYSFPLGNALLHQASAKCSNTL